ncbi:chorismate mutase [Candidatus Microgenomates bacterium]|nr:chorismate mutase [Candidatus Microgenomates bacterium]
MKLQQYREQIDDIDRELIKIIAQRNDLVKEFAIYKKHQQMPPFDMKRWKELIRTRADYAGDLRVDLVYFKKIYMLILRMALDIEQII